MKRIGCLLYTSKLFLIGFVVGGDTVLTVKIGYIPTPVSYTHLDVYKRQQVLVPILVLHRSGGKSPDVLLIVSDHGGDVYKRQAF